MKKISLLLAVLSIFMIVVFAGCSGEKIEGTINVDGAQTAFAAKSNHTVQKVLEKNGFRQEGIFREKYFLTDESNWTDGFQYGILRSQWEEDRKHEIG